MMRYVRGPLVGAIALLVAIAGIVAMHEQPAKALDRPFELVDSRTGNLVAETDFRGKWLLVFFGYTRCPDVCPTTLNDIAQAMAELGPLAGQVQPLFVTVDPARDTAANLAEYTAAFDRRIVGLTGTDAEIAAAAKTFGVYYARRDAGDDYFMDHSGTVYVVRPNGTYASSFLPNAGPSAMVDGLRRLIDG